MNIKKLQAMIDEPSGKNFHKKFGLPKSIKNHPLKRKMASKMHDDKYDLDKERSERGYGKRSKY